MSYKIQKKISLLGLSLTTIVYIFLIVVMFQSAEKFIQIFSSTYNTNLNLIENLKRVCSTDQGAIYLILGTISIFGLIKLTIAISILIIQIVRSLKTKKNINIPAYTFGILRPKVKIQDWTRNILLEKEIKAIKLHEEYHQNSFDPLAILLVNFSNNILPIFPGKAKLFENLLLLFELAADEYVFDKMKTKKPLLSSLMKLIDSSTKNRTDLYVGFSNITDRRISIHTRHTYFNIKFNTIIGSLLLFSIFIIFINLLNLNTVEAFTCDVPANCSSLQTNRLTCS